MRIVATVDAMAERGSVDQLIAPLRPRLTTLRPPRPLRFARLLFYRLNPLIVSAARWNSGQNTIPRTVLMPLADCVRSAMGAQTDAIKAAINRHTTADVDMIVAQGRTLWPAAAAILATAAAPASWSETGFGDAAFAPLARRVGALLSQMAALDRLCAETAHGLLPPRPEAVHSILRGVTEADGTALPLMVSLLLVRLPEAVAFLVAGPTASMDTATKIAMDLAVDGLLVQLAQPDGAQAQIAATSLAEAAAAIHRIADLLRQVEDGSVKPARRAQLQAIRQHLDAGCRTRFTASLQDQMLAPLRTSGGQDVLALEAAARGLRVLETEARLIGSGPAYDQMLSQAAEAVKAASAETGLDRTDQIRLVEILAGSDAALAMLDQSGPSP
jgi:hypothetical protein